MRLVDVTLGVPGLGIIIERYDLDEPSSKDAWDKNVALGHMTLKIAPVEGEALGEAAAQ